MTLLYFRKKLLAKYRICIYVEFVENGLEVSYCGYVSHSWITVFPCGLQATMRSSFIILLVTAMKPQDMKVLTW